MNRLVRTIWLILITVSIAPVVSAQGGGGRSDSAVIRTATAESSSTRSARNEKTHRRLPPTPVIRKPEPARLAITVNEGGSTLDLDRVGAEGPNELISVAARATSLIVRTLPAGTYTISARKPGFHDFAQTIDLAEGKRRRVNILLRPRMAILSVASNIVDARFSIDRVGEFDQPLKKRFVPPGIYRVTVSRRGYESRTVAVNLKRAGHEQDLNVALQPLRIDAVFDLANQYIASGKLDDAAALIYDVLLLNPSHAKANLLRGKVELGKGNSTAVDYFVRSFERGETLRLPMLVTDETVAKSHTVVFSLDRDRLGIESKDRFELNFAIERRSLNGLEWSGQPAFIAVRGTSDFHGKPIEPSLRLSFANADAASTPDAQMQVIFKLLTAWRTLPESRATR